MGLIYMRISPSGGRYIGQTVLSEEERWKDHVKEAYNKNSYSYNTLLNKAIRKYGSETFTLIILEDNINEDSLDEREIFWIEKYHTFYKDKYHGYNMTRGGSGHRLLKIEPDDLIIMWESGVSIIEIANYFNCERQAIRDRLLGLGYTSGDLRKRRGRIAANHRIENHYNKELILLLWNNGKSGTQIAEQIKCERHTICRLLKVWGISEEEIRKRQWSNAVESNKKTIQQFDKQGNFIQEWESISEAARQLKLYNSNICKVLKGERKTTGNFIFKYKENNTCY